MKINITKKKLQEALYLHKWILYGFYWGLVLALAAYFVNYMFVDYNFLKSFFSHDKNQIMLGILELVDIVMVANLIKMITTGSFQSFIDKVPENTEKVSSGLLKVKMGTSLVGITAIHLLQVFIEPEKEPTHDLVIKVIIHIVFLYSAKVLSQIDYMHSKSEFKEAQAEYLVAKTKVLELQIENKQNEKDH